MKINFSSLDMPTFRLVACHAIATAADRLRIFAKLIPGSVHARSESKVCVAMSASKDFMDFQRTVVKVNSNAKIMFFYKNCVSEFKRTHISLFIPLFCRFLVLKRFSLRLIKPPNTFYIA